MQYITKLKFKNDIFKSSKKIFQFKSSIFDNFFDIFFFVYIKMSENLSVRYYQGNKKRLQKKLEKFIKIFLKK